MVRRSFSCDINAVVRGAALIPQFPTISVVTPCLIILSAFGLSAIVKSVCEWISMNPGHTTMSAASMVLSKFVPRAVPILSILPFSIAMSARYAAVPVPSTILPFFINNLMTIQGKMAGDLTSVFGIFQSGRFFQADGLYIFTS